MNLLTALQKTLKTTDVDNE